MKDKGWMNIITKFQVFSISCCTVGSQSKSAVVNPPPWGWPFFCHNFFKLFSFHLLWIFQFDNHFIENLIIFPMIYNMLGLSSKVFELFSFFCCFFGRNRQNSAKFGKNHAVLEQRANNWMYHQKGHFIGF